MKMIDKRTKIGAYTLALSAIVIAVIVVINLVVAEAPSKYTQFDVTPLSLYTLSDETKEAVSKIDDNIKFYFIASGGEDGSGSSLNNIPSLSVFLQKYTELNGKIKLEIIDPVEKPNFESTYSDETIENYSIIVESAKRFKILSFSDLYYYYNENYGKISPEEYQTFVNYMYYYGEQVDLSLNFDGESKITSALDFVTTNEIPAVYSLTGHGESALSDTLVSNIENDSMSFATLSLLTSSIPEDAETVIINAPTSDINSDEAAMISDFLANGGKIILTTVYQNLNLPNLMGVLSEYGLSAQSGMVVESNTNNYYNGYPYYLLPTPSTSSALTSPLASSVYMFMPFSHAILTDGETDKSMKVDALFTTSSSAYTITDDAESTEKTDDSIVGEFKVAVSATEKESGAQIIWFASPAFSDNFNSVTGGNYKYFSSVLGGISERDRITNNIPATEIGSSNLVVSETQATIWSALIVIIIPLAVAVWGVIRWQIRRKA